MGAALSLARQKVRPFREKGKTQVHRAERAAKATEAEGWIAAFEKRLQLLEHLLG